MEQHELGRQEAFDQAVKDFAAQLPLVPGLPEKDRADIASQTAAPDLSDARYESILAIHMDALARLLQNGRLAPNQTAVDVLLNHEQRYRDRVADAWEVGLGETRERAVAAAVLCGAASPAQARTTVGYALSLTDDQQEGPRRKVAAWIATLYPPPNPNISYWGLLQPDLLAEHLIGRMLCKEPDLLTRLAPALSLEQVDQALTVLTRAATHPDYRDYLSPLLTEVVRNHPRPFALRAIAVAPQLQLGTSEYISQALQTLADDPDVPLELVKEMCDTLPVHSHALACAAVALATRMLGEFSEPEKLFEKIDSSKIGVFWPITLEEKLSHWFAAVGDRKRALDSAENAVARVSYWTSLAPNFGRPALAALLNTLAHRLAELGRSHEALTTIDDAVAIQRNVAKDDPGSEQPHLAIVLSGQSDMLAALGRFDDALSAIEEAVAIQQGPAETDLDYRSRRKRMLNTLSERLGAVSRHNEALAAAEEAVQLARELAEAQPDIYLTDMALSLKRIAIQLSEVERFDQAIVALREGIGIWRRLAETNPRVKLPELAGALHHLSNLHVSQRRVDLAITPMQESVDAWRLNAQLNPDDLPALARALDQLSRLFSASGDNHRALAPQQESVNSWRQLAEVDPGTHLKSLAEALTQLSILFTDLRLHEHALAPQEEAVSAYRQLAETDPNLHPSNSAQSPDSSA